MLGCNICQVCLHHYTMLYTNVVGLGDARIVNMAVPCNYTRAVAVGDARIVNMAVPYNYTRGRILKQVYNIVSQQHTISPRRVIFVFASRFIERNSGCKLNSRTFYYNLYYKNHPKWEKEHISSSCLVSCIQNKGFNYFFK